MIAKTSQMFVGLITKWKVVCVPIALATEIRKRYSTVNITVSTSSNPNQMSFSVWVTFSFLPYSMNGLMSIVSIEMQIMMPIPKKIIVANVELPGSSSIMCRRCLQPCAITGRSASSSESDTDISSTLSASTMPSYSGMYLWKLDIASSKSASLRFRKFAMHLLRSVNASLRLGFMSSVSGALGSSSPVLSSGRGCWIAEGGATWSSTHSATS
mmetsp:Transcript_102324/g.192499  ORF Transcript_102324/g.192499 Transcript_102324/m.192499 type:complete len:213 (-) Transcript_102324:268-906(-)